MLRKVAPLFAIVAGCMWGAVGPFVRTLEGFGIGNVTIVELRMTGAALMLFLGMMIIDKNLLRIKFKDLWIFVAASLATFLGLNYFYNVAIIELRLSLASILLSTMPVFIILLSLILFKERITFKKVGCMLMVILGCACVSGIFEGAGATLSVKGVAVGFLAAIGYACYGLLARIGLNRGYHALNIIFYSFVISSVVFAFFADWGGVGTFVAMAPVKNIGFLILHSFVCAAAPYALFNYSMNHIDTGTASILASCEPVAATIFGFVLFDEIPTIITVAGIAVVLIALAILSRPEKAV